MGKSAPPPAPFDLVDSYARVRDDEVELRLSAPTMDDPGGFDELVLRRRGRVVTGSVRHVPAQGCLLATVSRAQLEDGTWAVRLRGSSRPPLGAGVRLLVQGARPVVLLWGTEDGSEPPRAHPARAGGRPEAPVPSRARRLVVGAGSRTLDAMLTPLPAPRRREARRRARTLARRVLG